MLRTFKNHKPQIAPDTWVDESAVVIGDVAIGAQSSVWMNAVLRGDVNRIRIGARSNIQDLSMLHVAHRSSTKPDGSPLSIGDDVTIGHQATLHGCTIGNRVLVGMGSIVLDDAVVEDEVIIGAGSLVPPRKRLASGFLYVGSPVQAVRPLSDAERASLLYSAEHYVKLAAEHRETSFQAA